MKKTANRFMLLMKIIMLDLAVFLMFFVISITPPKPVVYDAILPAPIKQRVKSGIPIKLTIKSLNMDLPVGMGTYDPKSKTWTIDATQAYYAADSTQSNEKAGTTLIYGHARRPIFGNLSDIKPGAKAIVKTKNGYSFDYIYQSVRLVSPSDTGVLYEVGSPQLVLQTCSGAWDSYRALYYFKLEKVNIL